MMSDSYCSSYRALARTRGGCWWKLAPKEVTAHPVLHELARWLAEPANLEQLHTLQRNRQYPHEPLAELRELGLPQLLGRNATAWHACALNALVAAVDGSLAITLGVNQLALLPIHLDGSEALRERVFGRVAQGELAAMLLSEEAHGSNLGRTQTRAEPVAGGFELFGAKDMINGGTHHDLLTVLARTGEGSVGAHTLLWLARGPGVRSKARWETLPAAGADISGVEFDGAFVDPDAVVGAIGDGLSIVRKTLTLSRGGVSALAAGAASGAVAIALDHARRRNLYGTSISSLDPIADHLVRASGAEAVAAAASLRSAAWCNAFGVGAATMTAAAKLVCPNLAEEVVGHGRRVVSARALMEEHPYTRFVRDVLLYGVFDGTSHLMLQELAFRLDRMAHHRMTPHDALDLERRAWGTQPRPVGELGRPQQRPKLDVRALARALSEREPGELSAAVADAADALFSTHAAFVGSKLWERQTLRFELGECLAWLEALLSVLVVRAPSVIAGAGEEHGERVEALESGAAQLLVRLGRRLDELRTLVDRSPLEGLRSWERYALHIRVLHSNRTGFEAARSPRPTAVPNSGTR